LAEYIRADLPTTGAHCPFCDSGLVLTNEEAAAVVELSQILDLRPAQVWIQALRVYQLHVKGKVNVGCSVDGPLITTDCPQCRSARKDWQSNKQNIPTAAAPTVDPVVIRAAVEEIWDAAEARPLGTLSIDETVAILNKHLSGEAGKQEGE
jgi:hypothetical protein